MKFGVLSLDVAVESHAVACNGAIRVVLCMQSAEWVGHVARGGVRA